MNSFIVFALLVCGASAIPTKTWTGPLPKKNFTDSRIINGVDAQDNQFPYMVSLNYVGDGHACGASVLTPSYVLTAAHCCVLDYPTEIYAGSVVLSAGGQTYAIAEKKVHPEYDANSNWKNDICVIRLQNPLQMSDRVIQVTIAAQDTPVNGGDNLLISGWGYTTPNGNQVIPDRMQVGYDFKALSNEECGSITSVGMGPWYLCARGNPGQGVCQGDSGGPLMRDNVQVGVVSWVYLPCGSGLPDFYSRVPTYTNWIVSQVGAEAHMLKIAKV